MMPWNYKIVLSGVVVLAIGTWAFAEQNQRFGFRPEPDCGGPFSVTVLDNTAILLDASSGQTWLLESKGTLPMWTPIQRMASNAQMPQPTYSTPAGPAAAFPQPVLQGYPQTSTPTPTLMPTPTIQPVIPTPANPVPEPSDEEPLDRQQERTNPSPVPQSPDE